MHEGVDLRAPTGTPVLASAAGEIIHAGRGLKGYGRLAVVDHGGGWTSVYAHLSRVDVRVGDHVTRGEKLGLSGRSGRSQGPHLHFEIRKGADPLDPLLFLPQAKAP
jgi:murein DD-endopeptidase MepM/ murein hydrolase activator NlpD